MTLFGTQNTPHEKRISDFLREIITQQKTASITLEELTQYLGERAFGVTLLLFSLPNCFLVLPGLGSILGFPIFLFAIQMIMGQHKPWLPQKIKQRRISRDYLQRVIFKASPYLQKFEKLCRPRLEFLLEGLFLRLLGVFIALLAFLIILPFPGTNWLPAISISIVAIGLIERDGLLLLISLTIGIISCYVSSLFVYKFLNWLL